MSTAKIPQEGKINAADFAAILSTTLAMADEAGLSVGVRNRTATGDRPAGLLIFIEGLNTTDDGRLIAEMFIPQVIEGHTEGGANAAIVDGQRV